MAVKIRLSVNDRQLIATAKVYGTSNRFIRYIYLLKIDSCHDTSISVTGAIAVPRCGNLRTDNDDIQLSVVITRSNITRYWIYTTASAGTEYKSIIGSSKDTPYLTLLGELQGWGTHTRYSYSQYSSTELHVLVLYSYSWFQRYCTHTCTRTRGQLRRCPYE